LPLKVCNSLAFSIFTKLRVHHFWFQNILITSKRNPHVHRNHFPCLSPCQTPIYLLFLCICMLWKLHKNGIIQHIALLFRLLLLNCIIVFKVHNAVTYTKTSFFFCQILFHCMTITFCSSAGFHLDCFQFLTSISNASMNISV
jgi:hypothetical protein